MNADGTELRRIARWMWYPLWSPDGSRILAEGGFLGLFYPSDNFIEDDRNLLDRRLGDPSASLRRGTWSPSGKAVAATSDSVLWVVDADGSNQKSIVKVEQGLLTSVSWSPDGQWLAYSGQGVSAVNTLDSRRRNISSFGLGPVWNPRANKIAYYWNTDSQIFGDQSEKSVGIHIHDFDSGRTDVIDLGSIHIAFNKRPLVWSPDGRYLAFEMKKEGLFRKQPPAIYVLDVEKRELHKQVDGQHFVDSSIKWSPDGTKLLLALVHEDYTRVHDVNYGE